MKRRLGSFWAKAAVAAAIFLAASISADAAGTGILKMAVKHSDAKSIDPHQATGSQDRIVAEMIFDALVRYKPGNITEETIEPDLAERYERSADGKTWTFFLRKNVMWQPYGDQPATTLTAEDVAYSLKRAADPKRSAFAGDYSGLGFEAVDPHTVKITLQSNMSPNLFLPKVANRGGGLVVCRQALEKNGDAWYKTHPVGTGPFMFKSYEPMNRVVLSAFEKHFRGAPLLAGVEYYYMPDQNSREMALQKGEMHVIEGPREQAWAEKMAKVSGIVVDTLDGFETIVAHLNMSVKPLDNLKVRQAVLHAINQKEFRILYGEKFSEPIYSAVHPRMTGGLTREEAQQAGCLYEYDVARAKKLLAEAGYPNGFSLKVFTSQSETYQRAYEVLQAQLRKVGINIDLSVVDHPTFHARIRENLDPIVVYVSARPNPDTILTQYFKASSIVATGAKPVTNFSHYGGVDADGDGKIDSVDDLISQANMESDPQKQAKMWKQAQIDILKNAAACPLISVGYLFARQPVVEWGYPIVIMADGPKATMETRLKP